MAELDLRKLRYFVTVAEELNFSRAAARLQIAQPVLSRQITALETELGATLFERSKAGTALTEAGELLLADAELVLSHSGALIRRARQLGRGADRFTIGLPPGLIVNSLSNELTVRFPGLIVDVVRTDWDSQVNVILGGKVDVGIIRLPVATRGLALAPLFTEPRLVVMPEGHMLSRQPVLRIADLVPFDILEQGDGATLNLLPPDPSADRDSVPVVHTVDGALQHVAAGRGLVVLPESAATFYTRPDVTIRSVSDLPPGQVALAHPAGRTTPQINAAIEIARELLATNDSTSG